MVEKNVLDNQLQTGQEEMPTLIGAVKDSSVVVVTLEEGEQEQETRQQETRQQETRQQETRLCSMDAEILNSHF